MSYPIKKSISPGQVPMFYQQIAEGDFDGGEPIFEDATLSRKLFSIPPDSENGNGLFAFGHTAELDVLGMLIQVEPGEEVAYQVWHTKGGEELDEMIASGAIPSSGKVELEELPNLLPGENLKVITTGASGEAIAKVVAGYAN